MKEIFGIPIKDAIMYGILSVFVLYIWWVEHKDINCPTLTTTDEKTCKEEGGMSFSGTKPKSSDSCHTLMSKIHKAAGAEQAAVKWRKALIFATAIGVVTCLVLTVVPEVCGASSLPSWQKLYIHVLVGYAILLGSYMYYSYHVYGVAEQWIRDCLKQMDENGCIAKP